MVADAVDTDAAPRFPGVVAILTPTDAPGVIGLCTGTLITPSHVVTAAHCLSHWNGASPIQVYFGAEVDCFDPDVIICDRTPVDTRSTIACSVHPGFVFPDRACGEAGVVTGDTLLRSFHVDVGVLTLDRPVPIARATAEGFKTDFHRLPEAAVRPTVGTAVTAVGYGSSTFSAVGVRLDSLGVRRFVSEPIERFTFGLSQPAVVLEQADVRGTAPGDSGGPALWETAPAGAFGAPPIGVASIESDVYASLLEPFNLDYVRAQIDRDGDGSYDHACGTGFDPRSTPENDADGDGILDLVDGCTVATAPTPQAAYDPCQLDRDFDGVGDACDSCPDHRNPGAGQTADADGDGVPDACDNCPLHYNPGQEDDDIPPTDDFTPTGDGVGDACDECARAIDPAQLNCNADAEIAAGLFEPGVVEGAIGVGDACDAVPCGDTIPETGERVGERDGLAVRLVGTTSVAVDALASIRVEGRTGFRICRCSRAVADDTGARLACVAELEDGTGNCGISDLATYDDRVTEQLTWRLASLFEGDANGDGAATLDDLRHEPVLGYTARTSGFEIDLRADWDLERDVSRWSLAPPLGFGETFFPQPLPAVLWTHAPGTAVADFDRGTRALSSHYYSGGVSRLEAARAPWPCFSDFVGPFLSSSSGCPLCTGAFTTPWLARPTGGGGCGFEPPLFLGEQLAFEALPAFARDPRPLLETSGKWVFASEPRELLPALGIRYAAVLPDGTLERLLIETPAGLSEPGLQPPTDGPRAARASDGTGVTPVAVLSAKRALLWTFEEGTITVRDLVTGGLRALSTDLGAPLAATYDPSSDRLAIVDEVREPGHPTRRHARVLSVDPLTGETDELARFARVRPTSRFALAADPFGGMFLLCSGGVGTHRVVHMGGPWQALSVDGLEIGHAPLAARGAHADVRGVSFVVEGADRSRVAGVRAGDLGPPHPRALERCF